MKLTAKRLLELGFEQRQQQGNVYFEKNKFCLFLVNGVWSVGSDFGALATSNTYVTTEEELIKYMQLN